MQIINIYKNVTNLNRLTVYTVYTCIVYTYTSYNSLIIKPALHVIIHNDKLGEITPPLLRGSSNFSKTVVIITIQIN